MKILIVLSLLAYVGVQNANSQLSNSPLNNFLKSIKKEPIKIPGQITITWQMILDGVIKYIDKAGSEIDVQKGRQQHLKLLTLLPNEEFLESLDHMKEKHPEFYGTICDVYESCGEIDSEKSVRQLKTTRNLFLLADEEKWEEVAELLKANEPFCPIPAYLKEYVSELMWENIKDSLDISKCPIKTRNQNQIDFDDEGFDNENGDSTQEKDENLSQDENEDSSEEDESHNRHDDGEL